MFINISTIDFNEGEGTPVPPTPPTPTRQEDFLFKYNIPNEMIGVEVPIANVLDASAYEMQVDGGNIVSLTTGYTFASGGEHIVKIYGTNITKIPADICNENPYIISAEATGVTEIRGNAFRACPSLTGVSFPNVTLLAGTCFNASTALTDANLPNVTYFGNNSFDGCSALTGITLNSGVTYFGQAALREVPITGDYVFPALTTIGNSAFTKTQISSIEATGLTADVGTYAFQSAYTLTDAVLDGTYTSVGRNAFHFCTALTACTLAVTVTEFGISAFNQCHSLADFTLPRDLITMGNYCFNKCMALSGLTFNDKLEDVGSYAFEQMGDNNGNGFDFHFPESLKTLKNYTFSATTINELYIPSGLTSMTSAFTMGCPSIQVYEFEEGYNLGSRVGIYGERNTPLNVEKLIIPDSVTGSLYISYAPVKEAYIGSKATNVGYNSNLFKHTRKIIYSDDREYLTFRYDFSTNNRNIEEIHFPPNTLISGTSTNALSFQSTSLNKVNFEHINGIIPKNAFYYCHGLTGKVNLLNYQGPLPIATFSSCTGITEVSISGSQITIDVAAFSDCSSLTSITIFDGVTNIATLGITNNLETFTIKQTTPPTVDEGFITSNSLQAIYVPAESVEAYKAAPYWSDYAAYITAIIE